MVHFFNSYIIRLTLLWLDSLWERKRLQRWAGLYHRVRKGVRQCLLITAVCTLFINVIIIPFGQILFRLFTRDAEVIEIGVMMMRFLVPAFMTYICIEIYSGALWGMGDSLISMLITCEESAGCGCCGFCLQFLNGII